MKQLLFVLASLCVYAGSAQPLCSSVEDFEPGMKFVTYSINPAGVATGNTGANASWDYSGIALPPVADTQEIIAAAGTAYAADYPDADYLRVGHDESISIMQKLGDRDQLLAYEVDASLIINYDNPLATIRRPFGYQDELNDTAYRSYEVSGIQYSGKGFSYTVADGWGTLMLPGVTYGNTLRVRNTHIYTDTADANGLVTLSVITNYSWYDDSHVAALFSIDSVVISNPFFADTTVSVSMLKTEIGTAITEARQEQTARAYYAAGSIYVLGDLKAGDNITVTVYDLMGRRVADMHQRISADKNLARLEVPEGAAGQLIAHIGVNRGGRAYQSFIRFIQ
jgi:hypothetical protein